MSYVYACSNKGECRKLLYISYGWSWAYKLPPQKGMKRYFPKSTDYRTFKCCTGCHLPLDAYTAMEVNQVYGNKQPTVDDILASLDLLGDL